MSGIVWNRLVEKGIVIPAAAAPAGAYVPYVILGPLVFVSGQLPLSDGAVRYRGRLGADVSLEDGQAAARLCGLNILAQVQAACLGNLDRVIRVVRLGGFVACTDDFFDHPKVLNGASELMREVFDEAGVHVRAAVGAPSLPLGAAVEVEALFEVR